MWIYIPKEFFIIIGCAAMGVGYGIAQPYIYDVVSRLATGRSVTYALALVMVMNYVAVVVAPFILEFLQDMTGLKSGSSPFLINAVVALAALIFMLWLVFIKKRRVSL